MLQPQYQLTGMPKWINLFEMSNVLESSKQLLYLHFISIKMEATFTEYNQWQIFLAGIRVFVTYKKWSFDLCTALYSNIVLTAEGSNVQKTSSSDPI